MKFAIIASKKDPAGMNIARELEKLNLKPRYFLEDSIYLENIDKNPEFKDTDFIIFTTKHQSKEKIKTLTVHAPGNWRDAEFGGEKGKICSTNSLFLKHIFQILNKNFQQNPISEFKISMEVTHHGPYIEKPCCFIEIGSSQEQWKDKNAALIIAKTVKEAIETFNPNSKFISAILLGGGHYNQAANKIMLRTNYAVGHICPKYFLAYFNEEMLQEAINKTSPKPEIILIDWKGLGQYKQQVVNLIEKLNLKYERIQNILKIEK